MFCGSPPEIAGAVVSSESSEYAVGTTVKYQCKFGYVSRNSRNFPSICEINEQNGKPQWTDPVISCVCKKVHSLSYSVLLIEIIF